MENIKMALFDVDKTLVYGKKATAFYRNYSRLLEESFAETLGVELFEGKKIVDLHRVKYHGAGEKAFETYRLSMEVWYDALLALDPKKYLEPLLAPNKVLGAMKREGIILGAITDGPRPLVDKIFNAAGIDASQFDFIIGWERGLQMPKSGSGAIYEKISKQYRMPKEFIVMTGDSLLDDILPAVSVGLRAIHISNEKAVNAKDYLTLKNIRPLTNLKKL
jgi:FMN phosphatase YigB (HAD superfamily)